MIQANELRIGNLIQWESTSKIEPVEKIDICCLHFCVNDVSIEDALPIPITEVWLTNFGFTFPDAHYLMWIKKGFGPFRVLFDIHLKHWQIGYLGGRAFREIKYIHELQNIYFALTGEELKLNEI